MLSDPVTGQKVHDDRLIDSSGGPVVNILNTSLKLELGLLEETFKAVTLLPHPLSVHEDTEAFIEREIVEGGLL